MLDPMIHRIMVCASLRSREEWPLFAGGKGASSEPIIIVCSYCFQPFG
jgi:hypothetical protein